MFSTDPADLFSQLYDALDEQVLTDPVTDGWPTDPAVQDISIEVAREVTESGRLRQETTERYLVSDDPNKHRYAILLGLDLALENATLGTSTFDQSHLGGLTDRYLATGRLDSGELPGAVLPRFAQPAQEHAFAQSLQEAFTAVVRVPEAQWRLVNHVNLVDRPHFPATVRAEGLFVACAPFISSLEEIAIDTVDHHGSTMYRARLRAAALWSERLLEVLEEFDRSGAMIGVLPELALTPELLESWQRELPAHPPPAGSRLRWILAGSGPLDGGEPPPNRAVVLDRVTGQQLFSQDKQFRFNLTAEMIQRWNLGPLVGEGPADEYIARGDSLTVTESRAGRFAILVCEDVSEVIDLGPLLRAVGVSHLLVPIFSQPIRLFRWEHQYGGTYVNAIGSAVTVCNSDVIADPEPGADQPPWTSMGINGIADGHFSTRATEPAVCRFTEEGVVLQVVSPPG